VGYAQTAHKAATDIWGAFSAFNKSPTAPAQPSGLLIGPPAQAGASSGAWSRWAPAAAYTVGGALIAGAAAGTAFYKRNELTSGYTYLQDHMKYAGNLWDENALKRRVDDILRAEQEHGITFRT
jgi:hypothetical protein